MDPLGIGGVMSLWWKEHSVEMMFSSKNFMDTRITLVETRESCRITWVHAKCDYWER